MRREAHRYFGETQDRWYIDVAAVVGDNDGHAALEVCEQSAQTIVGMDEVRFLRANHASERRQLAQVSDDSFAGDAVAEYLHAARLKSRYLLFDKRRETPVFIGCYYEDFHF